MQVYTIIFSSLQILLFSSFAMAAPPMTPSRPSILRSISSGMVESLRLWPDELVVVLKEGYDQNQGYYDGVYFGICHLISAHIEVVTSKMRSPAQVRAKLKQLGLPISK